MKIKKQFGGDSSDNYRGGSIDKSTLDILCKYVISPPTLIRLSHVSDLNYLIKSLDQNEINNDIEKLQRVQFIRRAIDARIGYNLNNIKLIVNHILTNLDFDPNFVDLSPIINNPNPVQYGLSADEIEWVNTNIIEGSSKFGFMERDADKFLDICTRIKSTDYAHRGDLAKEFEALLDVTKNDFRRVSRDDSITGIEFSLRPGEFEQNMREIHEVLSSPSRRLICGMQGLNNMTGGGFESTRIYILLGITGVGKSMTLLDLAQQIKKYNKHYKPKDPTRTPVIVYLTMENSVVESVNRLFVMTTQDHRNIGSMGVDDAINKMQNEAELILNDDNPIDIFIKYKPNMSVDTTYLYTLYDNLHDRGYEPICFIQDHLMRIKSVNATGESRFDLGAVVNEFKTFATEKDIPFITNFHLNRDAMKAVENYAHKSSNIDITQRLDKSNISESVQVLNNTDSAIIINKEYDQHDNLYMGFKLAKMRDKPELTYFCQPFTYGSEIKLVEDLGGPAMFKTSLSANNQINKLDNIRTSSANIMNSINAMAEQEPIDTSVLNNSVSMFSFSNDNSYIIDEPIYEEAPEEPELQITKKPPITSPIMLYDLTDMPLDKLGKEHQVLNIESIKNLAASIQSKPFTPSPITENPNEFVWDEISLRIASGH